MPDKQESTTRFDLRGSRTLAVWLAAVHGGAILAAWDSALPAAGAGLVSVLAAAGFVRGLRLHALRRGRDAVVRIDLGPELRIVFADGRVRAARLRARPLVHSWLVTLRLESGDGPTVVLVPPDSLSSRSAHKALRFGLRHGGSA